MTHLDAELAEQPAAIGRLLDTLPAHVERMRALAVDATGLTLVARGSSDNAARYAQYLVPIRSGLPVTLATPSLSTVYDRTPSFAGQLVVAVSQSGRSTDIVAVLAAAREQGRPTVAITNDPGSPLAAHADHVVDLATGRERSVAATKTYTTSLVAVAGLALALGPTSGDDGAWEDLRALPGLVADALVAADAPARETARTLHPASRAVAVGRGLNLATAHETALKITELTGTQVVPYSPADLRHGPIGAVTPEVPVLLVAPDEAATTGVLDLVPELLGRGAAVHVLGAATNDASLPDGVTTIVPVPAGVPPWLSAVVAVVPGQLVARALAVSRGVDIDRPGGLSKVTVTH
ncbi:glutamine--fructose-6-phosphate transaminase [Jatrophihabitans endophyticus]|uniref:Glutamine--fructose-6-phosphate transaminase n=1 Tax=Jatrophihabitans endophyticus TaxID=1206085 RepID=A0A1M5SQ85_9ACTN|nr:SIS domain-containing protein [Jatrophihabitans endophyticus]SHH40734.1 glutamine--fructose-6-phosphate transaminase [Jatrophihabitans endophyticus]